MQGNTQVVAAAAHNQLSVERTPVHSPLSELVGLLMQFASIHKLDNIAKLRMEEIIAFTKEAAEKEGKAEHVKQDQSQVSEIQSAIRADLQAMYKALEREFQGLQGTANATLSGMDKVLKATETSAGMAKDLKSDASNILSKLGQVTNVADKIASTTQSYRDVLVNRQTPSLRATVDPKVLGDMDRRAKQILVELFDEDGERTYDKSLAELITKANEALAGMTDANKPTNAKVDSVLKTRKNAVLLTLNSSEAANWVREPGNEETFANVVLLWSGSVRFRGRFPRTPNRTLGPVLNFPRT